MKFNSTGIQKFTSEIVSNCRRTGYISTMSGRRRYLPQIKSAKAAEKAKAERQAVNSTIQGSAADLLKSCLIEIDAELSRRFPDAARPHRAALSKAIVLIALHVSMCPKPKLSL